MAKGSAFEREICRALTDWWTRDPESDVLFWRTAMSGGRATVRRKKGKKTTKSHCGDIGALTDEGKPLTDLITFELKRGYRSANLHDLLDRTENSAIQTYEGWINQAKAAADAAGTPFWAIIHKRDRKEITLLVPQKLLDKLDPHYEKDVWPAARFAVRVRGPCEDGCRHMRVIAMPLYSFFGCYNRTAVTEVLAAWLKRSSSKTAKPTPGPSSGSTRTSRRS